MARRRSRLRGWAPVIVGAVLLVLGLVGLAVFVSADRPRVDRAEDVAVFSPPLVGRMTDVVSGELRREAGCTYLDGEDGRRWIVLFPDLGTRWEDDWLRVEHNRYLEGAQIGLRGMIVKLPVDGYETDIPEGCRPTGLFFLVQI